MLRRNGKNKMPKTLKAFAATYPDPWRAYQNLRDTCDQCGPLPVKMRELIKIGVEVARNRHGGLAAHIARARKVGASPAEIRHAIIIATPLIGLPDVLDAYVVSEQHLK
ncbi:MAG TPA: carboxymuconolactone decarboxylase family protein [bacterium]